MKTKTRDAKKTLPLPPKDSKAKAPDTRNNHDGPVFLGEAPEGAFDDISHERED